MRKKKILIVMNNLNVGGAEKALVSLLQIFDYSKYSVDLLLFKKEGVFLKQVPEEVNILEEPKNYQFFNMSFLTMLKRTIPKLQFSVIWNRILFSVNAKIEKHPIVREQKAWRYLRRVIPSVPKSYDVAVGFMENTPNCFCVEKVTADVKIGFIMNDYNQLGMSKELDEPYFEKLNYIVTDSAESREVLKNIFPQFSSKLKVIKSIISPTLIHKLADVEIADFPDGFKLISIGRLTYQKGYDLAMEACKILMEKECQFKWYILGIGEDYEQLKEQIEKLGIGNFVEFLGIRENHYPYLKQADIFVHTARFEGFGIVVSEARILHKPMVITDFSVAKSHITHNVNGLIAEMNAESIASNIKDLIDHSDKRKMFSAILSEEKMGTEDEIYKFYNLLGR